MHESELFQTVRSGGGHKDVVLSYLLSCIISYLVESLLMLYCVCESDRIISLVKWKQY